MNESDKKPRVFLSYSHVDQEIVERVARTLKDRGADVWFDEWKLDVGSSLVHEIEEGIRRAEFVVVFFSRVSTSSRWVREEYESGKIRQLESRDKVKILPARVDETRMPTFAATQVYADFRYSFVLGISALLKTIFGTQGIGVIDQKFEYYARIAERERRSKIARRVSFDETEKLLLHKQRDRWLGFGYSIAQLRNVTIADYGRSSQPRELQTLDENAIDQVYKFLGNTIRDFLVYRLTGDTVDIVDSFNEADSYAEMLSTVVERLYIITNHNIQTFGLPIYRDAHNKIADELDRLFACIV